MQSIKDIVKNRVARMPSPTPSVGIFKGLEPIVYDNGQQEVKKEFYIKLYAKFREVHLGQLKGSPISVFLCIALHSDEKGYSFPSVKLIAKETGYKADAIYKALEYLEKMKFILRIHRKENKTKKLMSNLYRIFPNSWVDKAK
jgi:penicillin-binding protein-related factor A (putative recombinase)